MPTAAIRLASAATLFGFLAAGCPQTQGPSEFLEEFHRTRQTPGSDTSAATPAPESASLTARTITQVATELATATTRSSAEDVISIRPDLPAAPPPVENGAGASGSPAPGASGSPAPSEPGAAPDGGGGAEQSGGAFPGSYRGALGGARTEEVYFSDEIKSLEQDDSIFAEATIDPNGMVAAVTVPGFVFLPEITTPVGPIGAVTNFSGTTSSIGEMDSTVEITVLDRWSGPNTAGVRTWQVVHATKGALIVQVEGFSQVEFELRPGGGLAAQMQAEYEGALMADPEDDQFPPIKIDVRVQYDLSGVLGRG